MSSLYERLERHVQIARYIFSTFKTDICPNGILNSFPRRACGISSEFLGKYLIDLGFTNVKRVSGTRGSKTHAWLSVDNLIVDITSDQFTDGLAPVYIGELSIFHKSFTLDPCTNSEPDISIALQQEFLIFVNLMEKIEIKKIPYDNY
jgi:hypothetical protein